MRRIICLLCLFVVSCGPKEEVKGLQIRVVWSENPSTESSIVWTSESAETKWRIYLSTDVNFSHKHIPFMQSDPIQYNNLMLFEKNHNPYVTKAVFKGLIPNTKYYLKIKSPDFETDLYWFKTAPTTDHYSLLFGGDSRSNHDNRRFINQSIQSIISQHPEIIAFVHGGDYIANGNDWRQWQLWLNDYRLTYLDNGRILPIIPTRGNHETDKRLYNQIFGLEENHSGYFTSRLGTLDLIVLNSEESIVGEQFQWLEKQLQSAQERNQWVFTNYHRPAYPAVKRPSQTKKWVPLFEKYGVRLAFESDGHTFKKTAPIYRDQINDRKGVIYLGEGGLGVKQRSPKSNLWYLNDGGIAFKKNHFILASHLGNGFQIEVLDETGGTFHEFQIAQREGDIKKESINFK